MAYLMMGVAQMMVGQVTKQDAQIKRMNYLLL